MRGFNKELKHEVADPIHYWWNLGENAVELNDWLGRTVHIHYEGQKQCVACGRKVKKLYQNGYCFPCVTTLAETDLCIVKPHECHFHLGTCRDEAFAANQCMASHYVYVSLSSQPKVGLTRKNREWIRWIDQGASAAVILAEVETRKKAGELEMTIAQRLPDKTDWRKMVRGVTEEVDLAALCDELADWLALEWKPYLRPVRKVHRFEYPAIPGRVPKTVSWSAEREDVKGTLIGLRGQYLLFDNGVFNVRKHAGLLLRAAAD